MSDDSLKDILKENPGDPRFPEYAAILVSQGRLDEALSIVLAGLSANPSNHRARILLSRIFYDKGYLPFSIRELEVLQLELPDNKYLHRLLERLAPDRVAVESQIEKVQTASPSHEEILAEAEFDIEMIEKMDEK